MKKYKALTIIPYCGMERIVAQVKDEFEELDIELIVDNTEDEAILKKYIEQNSYDIIIVENGMRRRIRNISKLPCVEYKTSIEDLFQVITMFNSFEGFKTGIIGNSTYIEFGHIIAQMLNKEFMFYELETVEQAPEMVDQSIQDGCELIIGEYFVWKECSEKGISALQIINGKNSIRKTLKTTVELCDHLRKKEEEKSILEFVINNPGKFWNITDENGKVLYDNFSENNLSIKNAAIKKAAESFGKIRDGGFWVDNIYWEYRYEKRKISDFGPFIILQVFENIDLNIDLKSALKVNTGNYTDYIFSVMLNSSNYNFGIRKSVIESAEVDLGVLVVGEKWTGRNSLAYEIHKRSKLKNNIFIRIKCNELTDVSVEKLFNLNYGHITILQKGTLFFEEVGALKKEHQKVILKFLSYKKNLENFRFMASAAITSEKNEAQENLIPNLLNIFNEIEIQVPSLREQSKNIPALVSFMLQDFNMKYGWGLYGVEAEGKKILEEYAWPGNLNQFKKVLNSSVSNVFGHPEITEVKTKWIREAIENSDDQFRRKKPDAITIEGTLEEIEKRIIHRVLQECDMNLSKAAKRLGIGRSTLYRKMGDNVSENYK